jgi:hypothetical protein
VNADEDWPTQHLCALIDALPDRVKQSVLAYLCLALHAKHRPTRATTMDIHGRITELVDSGLDQQLLVMGIIAFVDDRMKEWADPGWVEYHRHEMADNLAVFHKMRDQDELDRRLPLSDGEVEETIRRNQLTTAEEDEAFRVDVAEALKAFRQGRRTYFSRTYWTLYRDRRRHHLLRAHTLGDHRRLFGDCPPE